jgi:hypothetical protein
MKSTRRILAGLAAVAGLSVLVVPAYAHPGGGMGQGPGARSQGEQCPMGQGMGHGPAAQGQAGTGAQQGAGCGMAAGAGQGHAMMGGRMGHGMMGGGMHGMGPGAGSQAGGQSLMSVEERQAFREKMRAAATPEERRQIAEVNRAEMQKRAGETGATMHAPRGGRGPQPNTTPQ